MLSAHRNNITRFSRSFCKAAGNNNKKLSNENEISGLNGIVTPEDLYQGWNDTWTNLASTNRSLSDILFERYRKGVKDNFADDYREYTEKSQKPVLHKESVAVANVSVGRGRRKTSYARAYILPLIENEEVMKLVNDGAMESWCWGHYKLYDDRFFVNGKRFHEYFNQGDYYLRRVLEPLASVNMLDKCVILCTVRGGGYLGQADATRAAISWAISHHEKTYKGILKGHKLLKSDKRQVERKKYGKAKARKSFTWVKR